MTDNRQKRAGEAMLATYMQMASATQFARHLAEKRQEGLQRRRARVVEPAEQRLVYQQMEAQRAQTASVEEMSYRLQRQAPNMAQFLDGSLERQDFARLGLEGVLDGGGEAEPER